MKKISLLTLLCCLMASQALFAQAKLEDPLPKDPNTVVGKLPNGITYYLRHNEEPKGQASFYIIRNAGALLEEDDQDGLAHFLEHMAFQGTKNFPGKGIISTMERHGVAFGRDVNAYTTQNETVYNLSRVPTENPALLDTCLMILHDWSYYLTLSEEEIDAERGVISEEWRTRRNSTFRMQQQMFPILFKGSKYAERDVIGELEVIQNFKPKAIRDFYHKWYRTDLEAVAIVGDFDVKDMEARVKKILSTVPAIKNPEPRPFFGIPAHDEIYYGLVTDPEASSSCIEIALIKEGVPAAKKNTHAYLKENLIVSFFNGMINSRLAEVTNQANPPYMNGSISYGGFVRGYSSYNLSTTAKPNEEGEALEALLTENERAVRHGFQNSELERAKTNMLVGLESSYKEKDRTDNEQYIQLMQANFLEQEPMVDIEYYYHYMKQLIPTITVDDINAKVKEWNNGKNMVIMVTGPSEGAQHLTEEECLAIIDKVKQADIAPYEDNVSNASLISGTLKGGKVVAEKRLPEFDAVEWTLDNGTKVVFRKADYEKEEVRLSSYSKGGCSLYDTEMVPAASNATSYVDNFGLGDFDAIALNKILTGKIASTSVTISELFEAVNGSSTPQDVETMLQMVYLRFVQPRFDQELFESIISRSRSMLPMMLNQPQKVILDSLQMILCNYHPRSLLFNEKYLDMVTFERVKAAYLDRIKDASDFTFFIVGNIDEETIKPLVEKYIGSIPSEHRKEMWKDHGIRSPKGLTQRVIEVDLQEPKATVFTRFSKGMEYSTYNNICNTVLQGILDLRYTENIREKEGGTYGVSVGGGSCQTPYSEYNMTMQFDCDPARAEHLKSLIFAETEKLQQEAPTEEEMNKVVSNLQKGREQSKNHNSYWMNAIYNYYVNGINMADPKNYEDILERITAKDIQQFAQKLFQGADVIDLIFTPKTK